MTSIASSDGDSSCEVSRDSRYPFLQLLVPSIKLPPPSLNPSTSFFLLRSTTTTTPTRHQQSNPRSISISLIQTNKPVIMGKTNKFNDRDHAGLADGTAAATEHLPRYFAKTGHVDADPKKTKKNGAGKGGWGVDGEEVQDEGFNLANARRRSNSSSYTAGLKDFKTKFEHVEQDPVFEEDIHGAGDDEELPSARRVNTESSDGSIDEEDKAKSV